METVQIFAPAKLNLGLKIFSRSENGFHNLESIFQEVSLCDEIVLQKRNDFCCNIVCKNFNLPHDNTITKAFEVFRKISDTKNCESSQSNLCGVDVFLTKHIPSGSGLGGGSSDAASFIKAYAELNGLKLSQAEKHEMAKSIGSDVFFFLENQTGAAVVSGRGDIVKDISCSRDLFFLLAFPNVHVDTREAYQLFDKHKKEIFSFADVENVNVDAWESVYRDDIKRWNFVNDFTEVIASQHQKIKTVLSNMKNIGAVFAEMSGSGSTVFGVFDTEQDALCAQVRLGNYKTDCTVVRSCFV